MRQFTEAPFEKTRLKAVLKDYVQQGLPPSISVVFESSSYTRIDFNSDCFFKLSELLEFLIGTYSKFAAWRMGCNLMCNYHPILSPWLFNWAIRRKTFDASLLTNLNLVLSPYDNKNAIPIKDLIKHTPASVYNYLYTRSDICISVINTAENGDKHEIFREWPDDMYNKWFTDPYSCLIVFDLAKLKPISLKYSYNESKSSFTDAS